MKKTLALAMVLSVLGSIVVGCSKPAEDTSATGTTAATAGATAGSTAGAESKSTTGE